MEMAGDVARQMRIEFSSYFDSHIQILLLLAAVFAVAIAVGWVGNVRRTKHDKEHSLALAVLVMIGVLGLSAITTIFFNGLAARAALEQMEKIKSETP